MKRKERRKRIGTVAWKIFGSFLMLIGVGIFVSRLVNKPPSDKLSKMEQMEVIIDEGGCMVCHASPEYASHRIHWPVVGYLIEKDAKRGIRFSNMSHAFEQLYEKKSITQPVLYKLQRIALNRSMPPLSFQLVHWKSPLIKGKRDILLDWVYNRLSEDYDVPYPVTHALFQPIQPLPDSLPTDPLKATLGRSLYYNLSCASCHNPETGGTDNLPFSIGVHNQPSETSTLTTFNAIFHTVFSWDGKATTPEEMVSLHFKDPVKMQADTIDVLIDVLAENKELMDLFAQAYPDTDMTENTLIDALVEYLKTLITPNSPFDRYLKGDEDAISRDAKKGYDLFKKYSCATCHSGVPVGGLSLEYVGTANEFFINREELILEDMGHYKVTGNPIDIHRFKVPGLRNIELTYPYFHNSVTDNLRIAVSAMAYHQRGKKLSEKEKDKIIAFLKTLTGEHPDLEQSTQQTPE